MEQGASWRSKERPHFKDLSSLGLYVRAKAAQLMGNASYAYANLCCSVALMAKEQEEEREKYAPEHLDNPADYLRRTSSSLEELRSRVQEFLVRISALPEREASGVTLGVIDTLEDLVSEDGAIELLRWEVERQHTVLRSTHKKILIARIRAGDRSYAAEWHSVVAKAFELVCTINRSLPTTIKEDTSTQPSPAA